ncbi:MAG: lipopolysaccharide biosynthesis protein [Leptolyngbya sp.]|nr:MAG: lipopolysaccharide biosynthesis protein [Leptolyngbya sp.]
MFLWKSLVTFVEPVRELISKKLQNRFARNLGWLGLSQAFIRFSRLAATLLLPRFLTPEDYGLAALVLTTYEFTMTFTRVGLNAKVIQASDEELEVISNSAFWLNWLLYGSLFVLQCLAAFPIAWFYGNDRLILPICVLSISFLIAPIGRIQSGLIQRENRLKTYAVAQSIRYATANVLTAIFAIAGMGMWAIVLPRVVAAPLEFIVYLRQHSWRPSRRFTTERWGEIFSFGLDILGVQILKTARENMDYLIIGRFLGIRELGFYYFAYNAGLGISLTIINSITTALYPYLCSARENLAQLRRAFFGSLKTIALVIVPFVTLQSVAAPFYVPIIFGEEWIPAIPILILICLSAIPRSFDLASFHLLAAVDKARIGLLWNVAFTVIFGLALLVGVQAGVIGVAIAVLSVYTCLIPIYLLWATRYVFVARKSLLT